jgi:hypothetical protein
MQSDAPDWEATIEKIATRVSARGLETPAIILLEAHRPLTFFANQALIFMAPILFPLFGGKTEQAAKFFEERSNLEKLITRIEEKAREREAHERALRALRRAQRQARRAMRRSGRNP